MTPTGTAYQRIIAALETHGSKVRTNGRQRAQAQCPHHEDTHPSLSVTAIDGSALLHCHGGCETVDVLADLNLEMADLFDNRDGVTYRYPGGRFVRRTLTKEFPQSGNKADNSMYRVERVKQAVRQGKTVYVVEGEKDVHALESAGLVATCNPMGAGNWDKIDPKPLHDATAVVIVADKDEPGMKHARTVQRSLTGHVGAITLVHAKIGKDAADHIAAGHGADDFVPLPDQAPATDEPGAAAGELDADVARELRYLQVRDLARVEHARRTAPPPEPIALLGLDEFLKVPDDPVTYRVDRLWPTGARILLSAQYKAGKSTVVGNLLRSLADGEPFLGAFDVNPPAGRIALIDNELDERTLRRWLRDQGVVHTDRVRLIPLRGRVHLFDVRDPAVRTRWADELRAAGAGAVILDCLRPVLDALHLSEDKESGEFLTPFDAMTHQAGITESAVVHHMGHNGERARGDSNLLAWPDVLWRVVRQAEPGEEPDPSAPRFFTAFGRDVNVAEGALTYDEATRHLTFGGGNRRQARAERSAQEALPVVTAYLAERGEEVSGAQIEAGLNGSQLGRKAIRGGCRLGVQNGSILTRDGARGAVLHFLNPSSSPPRQTSPPARRANSIDLATSPMYGEVRSSTEGNGQLQLASGEVNDTHTHVSGQTLDGI